MTRATYTGKCCIVSRETGAGASYASAARAWSQSQAPTVHSCLAGKATDNGRHWPLQPLSLLSTDENPSRPHSSVRHNIWSSSLVITWSSWSVSVSEWCHAGHVLRPCDWADTGGWCRLVLWPRPRHYWGHWGRPQCLLPSVHSASASPGVSLRVSVLALGLAGINTRSGHWAPVKCESELRVRLLAHISDHYNSLLASCHHYLNLMFSISAWVCSI